MKHRKKKKGASLIIVLMVLAVAMIFSSVTLTTISKTTKANAQEKKSEDVLFSAESGLEYGIAWFNKNKTTGVISVPPTNGCTYDVKVEPDGSNYKIISKATINGKSKTVSVKVNKIETPGTGGGEIVLKSPSSLIVPRDGDILFNGTNRVDVYGINEQYELYDILKYKDKKIYDITKNKGGTGIQSSPTVITKEFDSNFDIEFKDYSLVPYSYSPQPITIPPNGLNKDIEINSKTLGDYLNSTSNTLISNKTVIINGDWQGDINLNNVNIYANTIKVIGYKNINLTNCKLVANNINIEGSSERIFKSNNISASDIYINTDHNTVFDNSIINSTKMTVMGNEKYFKNATKILSKDLIINTNKLTQFLNVEIKAENFNLMQSGDKIIKDSVVTVNNFDIYVSNGTNFQSSIITCGIIDLKGSCDKVFNSSIIKANKFKISSSNVVYFQDTNLFVNNLDVSGDQAKTFDNSIVISKNIYIQAGNNINFKDTLTIAQKFYFKAERTYINKFTNGTFNDKFKKAQEQLIITGQSTPPIITYEIDNRSIKYE